MGKSTGLSLTGRWSTGASRAVVCGGWSVGGDGWLERCSRRSDAVTSPCERRHCVVRCPRLPPERSGVKFRRGKLLGRARSSGEFDRRANLHDRDTARSSCSRDGDFTPCSDGGSPLTGQLVIPSRGGPSPSLCFVCDSMTSPEEDKKHLTIRFRESSVSISRRKGKPLAKEGRKATGLSESAGPPKWYWLSGPVP